MPQGDNQAVPSHCAQELEDFEQLFGEYENSLYHFVCYLCGEKDFADEIYQETWLRAARFFSKKKAVRNFKSWINTIAKNVYRDELRKRKVRRLVLGDSALPPDPDNDSLVQFEYSIPQTDEARQYEIRESIEKAITTLSARQKTIFMLFYVSGFRITEICEIMGAAEGTIKSTLHKTVLKLRKEIGEMT
ncbi:hypothetical protein A2V82_02785 [candidate division KSB1 bacterium RBG_16_48_16]|nr:MAG: hypothetical protein A2V82_02785 [candidate division KSB1 bacterium RBG_16_48_16]